MSIFFFMYGHKESCIFSYEQFFSDECRSLSRTPHKKKQCAYATFLYEQSNSTAECFPVPWQTGSPDMVSSFNFKFLVISNLPTLSLLFKCHTLRAMIIRHLEHCTYFSKTSYYLHSISFLILLLPCFLVSCIYIGIISWQEKRRREFLTYMPGLEDLTHL